MAAQFWSQVVGGPVPGPGATISNSTSFGSISPAPPPAMPANSLGYTGATLRVTAYGSFSTTGTPTLLLAFLYGTSTGGQTLASTGAVTTGANAASWPFIATMTLTVRSPGSSGSVIACGKVDLGTSLTAFQTIPIPNTALAPVTIDTTLSGQTIPLFAQWGTASASNAITCQTLILESLV